MIDVKELRVGNLVLGYYAYNDENDQEQEITSVCRVLSIDSVGAHEYPLWVEAIGKANDVEEYDGFVAIPLTEEWLIDLGFRKDEETNYRWFMEDWLAYDLDDNCIRIADSWEFGKRKYVHELQNLFFALTGEELELKTESSTCLTAALLHK